MLLAAVHRGVRVGDLLGQVPCLLRPDETLCALAAFEGSASVRAIEVEDRGKPGFGEEVFEEASNTAFWTCRGNL